MLPSVDHSNIREAILSVPFVPRAFSPPPPVFRKLRWFEQTAAATRLPAHLHHVLVAFLQKPPPLVSSSSRYQTLHELVEQPSVFRDGVFITFLLYKQMLAGWESSSGAKQLFSR